MTILTAVVADLNRFPFSLRERAGVREAASTSPKTQQLATPAFEDCAGGLPHPNPLPEGEGAFSRPSCISGNPALRHSVWCPA